VARECDQLKFRRIDFSGCLSLQPGLARIKSIRDVFEEYEFHAEPKSADAIREIPGKESAKAARISERAIKAIRNGHARPSAKTRKFIDT
jgi:hypothetical protein